MTNFINKKVLITAQNWFYGTDGKQYKAIWGTLKAVHEAGKTLGFIPNRSHANWFVEVGGMIVMGCQIMYLVGCEEKPPESCTDYQVEAGIVKHYERPTSIFMTE